MIEPKECPPERLAEIEGQNEVTRRNSAFGWRAERELLAHIAWQQGALKEGAIFCPSDCKHRGEKHEHFAGVMFYRERGDMVIVE